MVIEPFRLTHTHTDTRWHEKTLVIPYVVRSSGRLTFFLSILECVNYLFDVARRWGGKVTPLDAESGWNSYSFTGFFKKNTCNSLFKPHFCWLNRGSQMMMMMRSGKCGVKLSCMFSVCSSSGSFSSLQRWLTFCCCFRWIVQCTLARSLQDFSAHSENHHQVEKCANFGLLGDRWDWEACFRYHSDWSLKPVCQTIKADVQGI